MLFGPFDWGMPEERPATAGGPYNLGATRPMYFVRRVTVSPPWVSY